MINKNYFIVLLRFLRASGATLVSFWLQQERKGYSYCRLLIPGLKDNGLNDNENVHNNKNLI